MREKRLVYDTRLIRDFLAEKHTIEDSVFGPLVKRLLTLSNQAASPELERTTAFCTFYRLFSIHGFDSKSHNMAVLELEKEMFGMPLAWFYDRSGYGTVTIVYDTPFSQDQLRMPVCMSFTSSSGPAEYRVDRTIVRSYEQVITTHGVEVPAQHFQDNFPLAVLRAKARKIDSPATTNWPEEFDMIRLHPIPLNSMVLRWLRNGLGDSGKPENEIGPLTDAGNFTKLLRGKLAYFQREARLISDIIDGRL